MNFPYFKKKNRSADVFQVLSTVYRGVGIGNFESDEASGEAFVIRKFLPSVLSQDNPIFFDVGANTGRFSALLAKQFSGAKIHAFEPMPQAFVQLEKTLKGTKVICHQTAMGEQGGEIELFDYSESNGTEHASVYSDVLKDLHKADSPASSKVKITTLTDFVLLQEIDHIDFLKVDVEGHELPVLKGALKLLREHRIPLIQFEFNEMNVVSRVFMKDFYDLLQGFSFYRLLPEGLLPMGPYTPFHEIFQFQNIMALDFEQVDFAKVRFFEVRQQIAG